MGLTLVFHYDVSCSDFVPLKLYITAPEMNDWMNELQLTALSRDHKSRENAPPSQSPPPTRSQPAPHCGWLAYSDTWGVNAWDPEVPGSLTHGLLAFLLLP